MSTTIQNYDNQWNKVVTKVVKAIKAQENQRSNLVNLLDQRQAIEAALEENLSDEEWEMLKEFQNTESSKPKTYYEPKNRVVVANLTGLGSPESKLFKRIYSNFQDAYAGTRGIRLYDCDGKVVVGFSEEGIARAFEKTAKKYGLDARLHTEKSYLQEFDSTQKHFKEKHEGFTKMFLDLR